jgi:hypothetical protein
MDKLQATENENKEAGHCEDIALELLSCLARTDGDVTSAGSCGRLLAAFRACCSTNGVRGFVLDAPPHDAPPADK